MQGKIDCKRATLMRAKLRNAAKLALNGPITNQTTARFEPGHISVLNSRQIFPICCLLFAIYYLLFLALGWKDGDVELGER